jgi:hypothetical protein
MAALGFIGFLFPLAFLALLVLVIGAVVGSKGDPDTTGRRPYAIYLAIVTFVGLTMTLGAAFAVLKSLTDTVLVGGSSVDCPPEFVECGGPLGGGAGGGREIITSLLILAVAVALTYLHGRKLLELRALEPGSSSAAARVLLVFAYAVCFLAVFVLLGAVVAAVTALVDVVDPQGGFSGGRDQAFSTLITGLAFGALTGGLFRWVWSTFDLGLKPGAPQSFPPPPPIQ